MPLVNADRADAIWSTEPWLKDALVELELPWFVRECWKVKNSTPADIPLSRDGSCEAIEC